MRTNLFPISGDLILVRARNSGKSANRLAQTLIARREANFSHLAITIDGAFAIHSMPHGGVQDVELGELLDPRHASDFRVLRHKGVDGNIDLQERIRDEVFFYLEQPYNRLFYLRIGEVGSFCSELAAKAYARAGLPLLKRQPRFVLPVHLEALCGTDSWTEVTQLYRAAVIDETSSELDRLLVDVFSTTRELVRGAYRISLLGEMAKRQATRNQDAQNRLIQAAYALIGKEPPPVIKSKAYWDSFALRKKPNRWYRR